MSHKFLNGWWLSTQIATASTDDEQNFYPLTLNSELLLSLDDFACSMNAGSPEAPHTFTNWDASPLSTEFEENWDGVLYMDGIGYLMTATNPGAGAPGHAATSPDGDVWTYQTTPTTANVWWYNAVYVASKSLILVATDLDGTSNFLTSADHGVTWVAGSTGVIASVGNIPDLKTIIWIEEFGLYLATGVLFRPIYSTDLITWTESILDIPSFQGAPRDIVYSPSLGIAVSLEDGGIAFTSTDGINWIYTDLGTNFELTYYGLAWSAPLGRFIARVEHHSPLRDMFVTSTDGVNWSFTPIGIPLVQHVVGEEEFLPGGTIEWDSFTNKFYTITQGDDNGNFTGQSLMTPSMNLLTSTDGTTWVIDTTVPSTHDFSYPVFGTRHFVAFAIKDANNMVMVNFHAAIRKIPT